MTTEQLTTAAHEAYQNLPSGHIAREGFGQIVYSEAFKDGAKWALKQEGLPVGEVSERSERLVCELFDFGRQDKRCFKQCEGCEWMESKQ